MRQTLISWCGSAVLFLASTANADELQAQRAFAESLPPSIRKLVVDEEPIQTDAQWFGAKLAVESSSLSHLRRWLVLELVARRVRIPREAYVQSSDIRDDGSVSVRLLDVVTHRNRRISASPELRWKIGQWRRWRRVKYTERAVCNLETLQLYQKRGMIPLVADFSTVEYFDDTSPVEPIVLPPRPKQSLEDYLRSLDSVWASERRIREASEQGLALGHKAWTQSATVVQARVEDLPDTIKVVLDSGRKLLLNVHPSLWKKLKKDTSVTLLVFPGLYTDVKEIMSGFGFIRHAATAGEGQPGLLGLSDLCIRIWQVAESKGD